jgi:valyl-tRNA synthetase
LGLNVLLRLFAPVLPYIADEVWSWCFAEETGYLSVHAAPWPKLEEFAQVPAPAHDQALSIAAAAYSAINKAKSDAGGSAGRVVESLTLKASRATLEAAEAVLEDVLRGSRVKKHELLADESLEPGAFAVDAAVLADKVAKNP